MKRLVLMRAMFEMAPRLTAMFITEGGRMERSLRYCGYAFSLCVLTYGLVLSRLTTGADFLNSYPFVRADGYDWFYQGAALYHRMLGYCTPALWFLRDPGFVLVCALDVALRARGVVVILAHTLAFLATGLVLIQAARLYLPSSAVVTSVTVIMLAQPLNYVRLYVLADPLAVAFLTVSTWGMLRFLRTRALAPLGVSGIFAVIGGMTQTYAAVPFLLGTLVAVADAHSRRRRLEVVVTCLAVVASLVMLKLAWRAAIPHEEEPISFGSLRMSVEMARFYASVWTLVYVPLIPLGVTALLFWIRAGRRFTAEVLFLLAAVITFAVLSFCYQWAEARFTFIYQPLVLLLLIALSSRSAAGLLPEQPRLSKWVSIGAVCSALLVLASVPFTPLTYYGPPVFDWRPRGSWVLEAWFSEPVDRFQLGQSQSGNVYAHARLPGFGPYPGRIVVNYLDLRARQQDRLLGITNNVNLSAVDPACRADAAREDNDDFAR